MQAVKSLGPVRIPGQNLPDSIRVSLYSMTAIQDGTSAPGFSNFAIALNAPFAWNNGGSLQPMGFDQLKLLYGFYKVFKTHVKATYTISDGYRHLVVMSPRYMTTSAVPTTATNAAFKKDSIVQLLSMYEPIHFNKTFDIATVAGVKVMDEDFAAAVTTSPAKICYCDLSSQPVTNNATSVTALIEVTFDMEFMRRINTPDA